MTSVSAVSNSEVLNSYIASQAASEQEEIVSEAKSQLVGNYDTFLKILVAQLQNQDPTAPMDPSEFTQQLVQYSAVEQQIATNEKLDTLLSTMNPNGITPLLSYVGQYVETPTTNKLVVQGGVGMLAYNLPSDASSVTLSVQDSTGAVIATVDGTTAAGMNRVAWDGSLEDGGQAIDGIYKFVLTAKDSAGGTITIEDMRAIGMVTSIETDSNGKVTLKVGNLSIEDTDVLSVFAGIGVSGGSGTDTQAETGETAEESEETPSGTAEEEEAAAA